MIARAAILLLLGIAVVGCSPPSSARFEVTDVQKHADCMDAAFPFVPIFHASRSRDESVGIFFQSRGGNFQSVDVVHFEVFGTERLPLGEPIPLDPVVMERTTVASDLLLGESCPEITDSFGIQGTITFDEFSQTMDGIIAGSLDGELVSLRSNEVIAGSFTGTFDFTVQIGQPFEEFRN